MRMLRSMTAFGRASREFDDRTVTIELRSVNNRYFDCSVKMPRQLGCGDDRIKPYLASRNISRGKLDINITVEQNAEDKAVLSVDEEYVNAYIAALCELRDKYGLKDDISVMRVAADRNVFTVKKSETNAEHDWEEISAVLSEAVDGFLNMRESEGARIEADIRCKLENTSRIVDRIELISENDVATGRAKIEERLKRVLSDLGIKADENRILTECALYADRIAVDEELVRLRSHFKAFESILCSDEPAGRKLDFLLQEMNREINTIGSKCQNSEAAQAVVSVKCELEKIREQIQNVE